VRSDPAAQWSAPDQIDSTIKFAAWIADGMPRPVEPAPNLAFRYLDREISPLRTTRSNRSARRSLDLLLANASDGLPIFAELKIGPDRPSYFALVQLLALAADLLPPSQRERLRRHAGASGLEWPDAGPYADLYIISLNAPRTGAYRARAFTATKQISERLISDASFAAQIRRIAYLEAVPENDTLTFRTPDESFGDHAKMSAMQRVQSSRRWGRSCAVAVGRNCGTSGRGCAAVFECRWA
jgi:hypothetical protein